jgi:hypothetical protein
LLHQGEGLLGGINFLSRLLDETDAEKHPKGEAAWDQVVGAGKGAVDYAKQAWRNPLKPFADLDQRLIEYNSGVDPNDTPRAPTFSKELERQAAIGRKRGEHKSTVGSYFLGGLGAKGIAGIGMAKPLTALDYAQAGYRPRQIADLESLYVRPGHHAVSRKSTEGWPEWIRDDPFFMVKPPGITKGRMYQLHYGADKDFKGASVKKDRMGPKGWSGEALGQKKYGSFDQLVFGTPFPIQLAEIALPLGGLLFNLNGGSRPNAAPNSGGVQNRPPR